MDFIIMNVFATSLDIAGITLSGIIISYLVYNRIKYKQMVLNRNYKASANTFNSKFATRIINQQAERSFDTISDILHKERRKLKRLMEQEDLKNAKHLMMMMEKGHLLDKVIHKNVMDEAPLNSTIDPYEEICRLAKTGLDIQKISEKVGVPPGEIELYLKLNSSHTYN
jgi:hypothetical protein